MGSLGDGHQQLRDRVQDEKFRSGPREEAGQECLDDGNALRQVLAKLEHLRELVEFCDLRVVPFEALDTSAQFRRAVLHPVFQHSLLLHQGLPVVLLLRDIGEESLHIS